MVLCCREPYSDIYFFIASRRIPRKTEWAEEDTSFSTYHFPLLHIFVCLIAPQLFNNLCNICYTWNWNYKLTHFSTKDRKIKLYTEQHFESESEVSKPASTVSVNATVVDSISTYGNDYIWLFTFPCSGRQNAETSWMVRKGAF